MIPIVSYGIIGTHFRQEVVVDEVVRENGSLNVLQDIRRHLSMQYGDDTPMTGWALQPAPSGVWLTRIERAFDTNYAPAYIAIAFLIPQGRQPKGAAMLKLITDTLSSHHSDYIRQGVIQSMVDWHFLEDLSADLEAYLTFASNPLPPKALSPKYGVAYSEDDITTLLSKLWDDRIAQCRMVFCGRGMLTTDKEFMCIEDFASAKGSAPHMEKSPTLDTVPTLDEFSRTDTRNHQVMFVSKQEEVSISKPQKTKGSGASQRNNVKRRHRTNNKVLVAVAVLAVSLIGLLVYNWVKKHVDENKYTLAQEIYNCYNEMNKLGKSYCGDSLYNLASALTQQCSQLSAEGQDSLKLIITEQYSPFAYNEFENSFNDQTERKRLDSTAYQKGLKLLVNSPKLPEHYDNLKPFHKLKARHDLANKFGEWKIKWVDFLERSKCMTQQHVESLNEKYNETAKKVAELINTEPSSPNETTKNDDEKAKAEKENALYQKCTDPKQTSVKLCEKYLKNYNKNNASPDHVRNVELVLYKLRRGESEKETSKTTNQQTIGKVQITNYEQLWNALTWENFHEKGMLSFLEKYEFVGSLTSSLKRDAMDIIDAALKGHDGATAKKKRFNEARAEAAKEPSSIKKLRVLLRLLH